MDDLRRVAGLNPKLEECRQYTFRQWSSFLLSHWKVVRQAAIDALSHWEQNGGHASVNRCAATP
eukprot:11288303-Karenia_brevis.AAC.1